MLAFMEAAATSPTCKGWVGVVARLLMPTMPPVNCAARVALLKMWVLVHVGVMAWERGGAASERIAVPAAPLITDRPITAEGLASASAPGVAKAEGGAGLPLRLPQRVAGGDS